MKPRSEAAAAIFEAVNDLHKSGVIGLETVKEFADRCLVPEVPEYSPEQIRAMRKNLNVSQSEFASMLNASTGAVQKWERGAKRPNPFARKLLNILERQGPHVLL